MYLKCSIPRSKVTFFIDEITKKGGILKDARKLSCFKKVLYGFKKYPEDMFCVRIYGDFDFLECLALIRKCQRDVKNAS